MSACSKAGSAEDIVVGLVRLDTPERSVPVPRERLERELELIVQIEAAFVSCSGY